MFSNRFLLLGGNMKRNMRIMTFVLILIMFISTFVMPANAATNVNYSVSSVSGAKGDTVTVTVKVSSSVGLTAGVINVNYDSSKLQYVSGVEGGVFEICDVRADGNSSIRCTGMTTKDNKAQKSGTFATLKFKILADSGTADLKIVPSGDVGDHCGVGTPSVQLTPTVSNGKVTITKAVTSIKLNKSSVTLKKGETSQLSATVSPSDATDKTVTYSTSNSKVAKVSSSGKITAVGGGTATITAKAGGKTATCKVTVTVAQTGISASGSTTKSVEMGDTLKLKVSKVPSDTTDNYSVTWSVADANIATVSSNGTVKGVALGTTTVTAKSNGWTVTYKITVTEPVTESSTEEEPSSEEDTSATEEPSSEEQSSTEPSTEPSTDPVEPDTTEPTTENKDFWEGIKEEIYNENNMISKPRYYLTMAIVAVAVAFVSIAVTYFVTSGYYKSKNKNK